MHAIEGLLAALFLGSGGSKLLDLRAQATSLAHYELLPARVATRVGYALPFVELGVATALLLRVALSVALATMVVLLAVFAVAVGSKLAQGKRVPCGCFGASTGDPAGWPVLARNVLLCAGATLALAGQAGPLPTRSWLLLVGAGAAVCIGTAQVALIRALLRADRRE